MYESWRWPCVSDEFLLADNTRSGYQDNRERKTDRDYVDDRTFSQAQGAMGVFRFDRYGAPPLEESSMGHI